MKAFLLLTLVILLSAFTHFQPKKKVIYKSPDLEKELVYFPMSSVQYKEADTVIIDDAFVKTSVYSLKPFYMLPYEVSNGQYREFIFDLKRTGDTLYPYALPDTLVWRHPLSYNEPYVDYYFRHPAYNGYPVVGITYKQCEMYCEWLTKKYNEIPGRKFKKVKFRLPSKYEWYAASVARKNTTSKKDVKSIVYFEDNIFPWDGPYLQNKEGKHLANYMVMDASSIHREYDSVMTVYGTKRLRMRLVGNSTYYAGIAGSLHEYADISAPVHSYWPNDAGIYNMAGNVEEFVAEYGLTKGGSWSDPGYYLRNTVVENYSAKNEATSSRGFRFVMEVIEE